MSESKVTISAFDWVPDFARGNVRDLVVRWALEELGRPYETVLLNAREPRGDDYVEWQPFDQVPALRDGAVEMFESGAILIYLAANDTRLMPREPAARMKVLSWTIAGLNAIEPPLRQFSTVALFHADKPWCHEAKEAFRPLAEKRMQRLSDALGEQEWIAGDFSIADIMLVFLLKSVADGELVAQYPRLAAYRDRGTARPAFQSALAAQLDDFAESPAQPAMQEA